MKQTIAWYEVDYKALPLQLFNEIRNAFDHYVRGILNNEDEHVLKLESHLQRGLLDVCKMLRNFHKDPSGSILNIIQYVKKMNLNLVSITKHHKDDYWTIKLKI